MTKDKLIELMCMFLECEKGSTRYDDVKRFVDEHIDDTGFKSFNEYARSNLISNKCKLNLKG